MFHPVGPLPARVYWRRRLVVVLVLLAVVGGATWLTLWLLAARAEGSTRSAATASPVLEPALERVVPALPTIVLPTPPDLAARASAAAESTPAVPAPAPGGPCTDDMIGLEVRGPGTAAVGDKPTFELVVTNASAVPCVRALDKGLQEIQLYDAAGTRRWGSNDCFPEVSSDVRTLAPGEAVSFPVVWGGLTSEPGCTARRDTPPPGDYTVVGRLDTKLTSPAALTLGQL